MPAENEVRTGCRKVASSDMLVRRCVHDWAAMNASTVGGHHSPTISVNEHPGLKHPQFDLLLR